MLTEEERRKLRLWWAEHYNDEDIDNEIYTLLDKAIGEQAIVEGGGLPQSPVRDSSSKSSSNNSTHNKGD